jgi:DsbC/DsbD-like thiol-disulfide interchange protein
MRRFLRYGGFFLFLGAAGQLLPPSFADAQSQKFSHGTVALVAEKSWINPGHDFTLGLHFSLENGWHIYWVNPGDSGQPPRVIWTLPDGLTAGTLEWPAPRKLGTPSIVDYGYEGDVTLLVPMQSAASLNAKDPATVKASLRLLICKDICIPGKTEVSVVLPVKTQPAPPDHAAEHVFTEARSRLPQAAPSGWRFSVSEEKDAFILMAHTGQRVAQAYFFPLEESEVQNAPQQKLTGQVAGFELTLRKSDELTKPVTRLKGVLQVSGDHFYLVDAPVTHGKTAAGGPGL